MDEEKIDAMKNWPKPKSICDIQVFLGFANFYYCFIQVFSRIAAPLTAMLKMNPTLTSVTQKLMNLVDKFSRGDCGENKAWKTSVSTKRPTGADYPSFNYISHVVSNFVSNSAKNISNYLIPNAKKAFDQLCQAFTKVPILQHFDPEQYIWFETDVFGHAIGGLLSQLTNDSGQWHLVAYYSWKMIPAKTQYKTHHGELLAIVEAFKTWRHYLKDCKHKVFVLIDYNNLCRFMNTKSLSFRQVQWAQELSRYHFGIDYCQGKANRAGDALSYFSQQDDEKKANLWAENTQILYYLQFSLTNAPISGLHATVLRLLAHHQVLIYGIYALL